MTTTAQGVEILGADGPRFEEVLTPEALAFVVDLVRTFTDRVDAILAADVGPADIATVRRVLGRLADLDPVTAQAP